LFGWIKRRLGIEKCSIDHEYYYDTERTQKRKIEELEGIINLKEKTITELNRHIEIQKNSTNIVPRKENF
jgi:hypothetical protein